MAIRLSPELYKKLAAEGSSTGIMPGEAASKWLARIKDQYRGNYNPPADMSLLSDKEIMDAVSSWVSKQSFNNRLTGKPIIQRQDSLILIPGSISPYGLNSNQKEEFRIKFPWLKFVPVMSFIHNMIVLRLVADIGKKDRKVVLGHHMDPRRSKHWKYWSVGHCQYGFPTVHSHNGDSIYPHDLNIRQVMRPIVSVNSNDSDEIVWLANSDIGLVALDWGWWQWKEKIPSNFEIGYIPYGPLLSFRGQTRILKEENPYRNFNRTSEGYHNPITFEEMPPWMNRVYKAFYATTETSSNCLPYNPQWDVDVADDQIKNPVIHGAPVKDHQSDWDELQWRYEKQYSAVLRKQAEWEPYWTARYKERNVI